MPTTVTSSIGTSSRDYSTLQAWEDAAPADLVTADQIWRGECYNDSTFSATLVVAGSTTDATRYKELTAAAGQSFVDNLSTNPLRFDASFGAALAVTGSYVTAIVSDDPNFHLSRMQFSGGTGGAAFTSSSTGGGQGVIDRCFAVGARNGSGFNFTFGLSVGKITNSIIKNLSGVSAGLLIEAAALAVNCTIYTYTSALRGIGQNYSNGGAKNCAAFGFPLANKAGNSSSFTFTTCATDVASPVSGYTGSIPFSTATFVNVTSGSEDLKLVSGSSLIDVGTTDSTNAATDIAGTSRPQGSAYDVGCWEYVSAGPAFKAGKPTVIGQAIGGMY